MKRLLFLIAFSLFTFSNSAFAQGVDYLRKANEAFIKGNYSYAVTMYKMYYVETAKDVPELRKMAEDCKGFLESGDAAVARNDIETARANYTALLKLNPEDNNVISKLDKLETPVNVPTNLEIGDEFMGGTVAYIDNTRRHGFVIHSVSKTPNKSLSDAIQTCPKGLRLPSKAEFGCMVEHYGKLPLLRFQNYYVIDRDGNCYYFTASNAIYADLGGRGFAIYLKDF